jgi:hypothetical protein
MPSSTARWSARARSARPQFGLTAIFAITTVSTFPRNTLNTSRTLSFGFGRCIAACFTGILRRTDGDMMTTSRWSTTDAKLECALSVARGNLTRASLFRHDRGLPLVVLHKLAVRHVRGGFRPVGLATSGYRRKPGALPPPQRIALVVAVILPAYWDTLALVRFALRRGVPMGLRDRNFPFKRNRPTEAWRD